MSVVTDEKESGKKIKSGEDTIEIEGKQAGIVIRIHATGKVAWAVAIGAIGVAVIAVLSTPVTGPAGPAVSKAMKIAAGTAAFGSSAIATSALAIAVAGGGIGILTRLKNNYKIEKINQNRIILHRRK